MDLQQRQHQQHGYEVRQVLTTPDMNETTAGNELEFTGRAPAFPALQG